MKNPGKTPQKQNPSDTHGSKALDKNKTSSPEKGPWKNPDPTNPKKSPEKINEPYGRSGSEISDTKTNKPKPAAGIKKEKITNAGESEHHTPVNKSDYETSESEYEDFELEEEEEEEDLEREEEVGETSSNYNYENEEDESKQFKSKVASVGQKKNEQGKLHQKQVNKVVENKNKSQLPSNFNQKKNNTPRG